ncbi:MAG: ATP-binding protein [Armatimonadota bacterium]|nr:ATP-binding protein [Armatimonadota bacterium]MCX7778048.1 ATP-binding protein [Armatimonadota bacterium]MDW8026068.1 ATP-binding protein [Armatimonadota bacterium]
MERLRFELTIPCQPELLKVVRQALAAFATELNMTISMIEDIKRAVTEACTNVIQHAYKEMGCVGTVHITCWVNGNDFIVEVSDKGIGMRSPEGLGIMLMRVLMDEVEIKVGRRGGTKVRMVKRMGVIEG